MQTLVLATQNKKKRRELEELVHGHFLVRTLDELGLGDLVIDESGDSFAANARIKAEAVLAALPPNVRSETFAVVADDSGIIADVLSRLRDPTGPGTMPGVRSARFAADHGVGTGDDANNKLLLILLAAVPDEMRTGRFVSAVCAALVESGEHIETFGTVEGHIARDLTGSGGFGYDPLFLPVEAPGKRMAELSADEKHAISHRGRAMRALLARMTPTTGPKKAATEKAAAAFVFKRARPRSAR